MDSDSRILAVETSGSRGSVALAQGRHLVVEKDFTAHLRHAGELLPAMDELIRQVKAFQHVRATGEVTPAGWEPGKPTLKPGPSLVGKVWKEWSVDNAF